MDIQIKNIMIECTKGSDEERLGFPDVVAKLMEAGVAHYHADLLRSEKTYYMPNGDSCVVTSHTVEGEAPQEFSANRVQAAVRAIQAQQLTYGKFCQMIKKSGCVGYMVSLAGRRAVYFGMTGDNYVELFPDVE